MRLGQRSALGAAVQAALSVARPRAPTFFLPSRRVRRHFYPPTRRDCFAFRFGYRSLSGDKLASAGEQWGAEERVDGRRTQTGRKREHSRRGGWEGKGEGGWEERSRGATQQAARMWTATVLKGRGEGTRSERNMVCGLAALLQRLLVLRRRSEAASQLGHCVCTVLYANALDGGGGAGTSHPIPYMQRLSDAAGMLVSFDCSLFHLCPSTMVHSLYAITTQR